MNSLDNYKAIKLEVDKLNNKHNLIVVTKNKSIETILPIIKIGLTQILFNGGLPY